MINDKIMKTKRTSSWGKGFAICILFGLACPVGAEQKGLGDSTGIARTKERPEVISLEGQLVKFDTHRCEMTTGSAPLGTHLFLKLADGLEINLHLGPSTATVVEGMAKDLKIGTALEIRAFRTEKMEKNAYVAVTVKSENKTVVLRDPESLRPVWAGKQGKQGKQQRRGKGQGK